MSETKNTVTSESPVDRERDRDGPIKAPAPAHDNVSEETCYACKTPLITVIDADNTEYYICTKCNPKRITDYDVDGCHGVCSFCRSIVYMNIDKDYSCDSCGALMCGVCAWESPRIWIPESVQNRADDDDDDDDDGEDDDQYLFCDQKCRQDHRVSHSLK